MARSPRSLQLTDLYRNRLELLHAHTVDQAVRSFGVAALDGDAWVQATAARVGAAQTQAVRATLGYLTAFLFAETGRRATGPSVGVRSYAGVSRDGRALTASLKSPVIGTKAALKDGRPLEQALQVGVNRIRLNVGLDVDQAARHSLSDAISQDQRFDGWSRALAGTCGACAARATGVEHGLRFQVHPGCKCVQEPIVRGVPNLFPRPTGDEFFAGLSAAEQNQMLGRDKAELVRNGSIALHALVSVSPMETEEDFISETPLADLEPTA
jgi:hypothetical protein